VSILSVGYRDCGGESSLDKSEGGDEEVDGFDSDEGDDDAAEAVYEGITAQDVGGAGGPVSDSFEGEGDEQDDDDGVEDDGAKDRALCAVKLHDVHGVEDRQRGEHSRDNREVFGDVVGDAEGGEGAACDEELFAGFDDVDEFGGGGVEVDHVACFTCGVGAAVHGEADVCLGEGGGVVGAVSNHGDELAFGLFFADIGEFILGFGFGDELVDAGFIGDGLSGDGVVAGDHDGADADAFEDSESVRDTGFDDVFKVDDADGLVVFGDEKGGPSLCADAGDGIHEVGGYGPSLASEVFCDRLRCSFPDLFFWEVDAAHAGVCAEVDGGAAYSGRLSGSFGECEFDDAAALRGSI